jgi:c-di-GMP-binding flagellar brake protein YcgR
MRLLKILRRLFRPRMNPRFYADKGVFVVVEPYTAEGRKVQVLDISEGGCAFIYNGSKEELEESGLLSLQSEDIPYLERLDFVTKSDNLLSDSNDKEGQLRRRSVEFKWLGVFDRKKLKEFIKQNFIGRAS